MRPTAIIFFVIILLCGGCARTERDAAEARELCEAIAEAGSVELTAEVFTSEGENAEQYTLHCLREGGVTRVTVIKPECIAGISAEAENGSLSLVYDGAILAAGDMTGDGLTPASALPLALDAMCEGYMESVWRDGEALAARFSLTESSRLTVFFGGGVPKRFEAETEGAVALTAELSGFDLR